MKLSINEQYKLLEAQKQRKRTLKEIGFTRILNEIGITSESTVFKEIEITEEKQGELKKIFEDKIIFDFLMAVFLSFQELLEDKIYQSM